MRTKALIKKLHKAVNIPEYKTNGSSGLDLEAFLEKDLILKSNQTVIVPTCLLYTSPSPRDLSTARMPSSA